MWLGIGYLIPMKGDKGGDPSPPPINLIIAENGDILEMQANTDNMIPELQQ
tara:strand:+ start:242 stop:394 length:153 start_codon:yes stop_codon:yes gene_type:complete